MSGHGLSGWNAKIQEISFFRHSISQYDNFCFTRQIVPWLKVDRTAHWLVGKRVNAVDIDYSFKCQQSSSFLLSLEYFLTSIEKRSNYNEFSLALGLTFLFFSHPHTNAAFVAAAAAHFKYASAKHSWSSTFHLYIQVPNKYHLKLLKEQFKIL